MFVANDHRQHLKSDMGKMVTDSLDMHTASLSGKLGSVWEQIERIEAKLQVNQDIQTKLGDMNIILNEVKAKGDHECQENLAQIAQYDALVQEHQALRAKADQLRLTLDEKSNAIAKQEDRIVELENEVPMRSTNRLYNSVFVVVAPKFAH